MTVAETLAPPRSAVQARWLYDSILVLAGSGLIALSAQVAVPLPFTPVPITGQTFAIFLLAALMGQTRGTLAVAAYLVEGLCGLPVFAGFSMGPAILLGPTGGYLIGFLPAAYVVGKLAELGCDRKVKTAFFMMLLGSLVFYSVGLSRLAMFVGMDRLFMTGLLPFIPGELVKMSLAVSLLPMLRKRV